MVTYYLKQRLEAELRSQSDKRYFVNGTDVKALRNNMPVRYPTI